MCAIYNINMRKVGLIFVSIILLVTMLSLIACAQPTQKDPDAIEIIPDQPHSIEYKEGLADCKMELDGEGHCTIKKSYAFSKETNDEETISGSYISNQRSIYINYKEDVLNFTGNYSFTKDDKLVYYSSASTPEDAYKTFQQAIGKVYEMSYQVKIDNMNATLTLKLKPVKVDYGDYRVAIGYTINVPEYTYASGDYSIVNGKFIKLKFNYSKDDAPTNGLANYQNMPQGDNYSTALIEEDDGRKNGLVRIVGTSSVHFVQLKDDGTFTFVRAATSIADEVCFTKESYYGQSFTTKMDVMDDNAIYSYTYKITFDDAGKASYECVEATMQKNYVATKEGSLNLIAYDIEAYNSLIGTHRQLGTSNNLSLANNYKIYADYNYSRYEFEGDLNIRMFKLSDYIYLNAVNDKGVSISAKFYEDGTWEWIESEFRGVDFSDHSEDFE